MISLFKNWLMDCFRRLTRMVNLMSGSTMMNYNGPVVGSFPGRVCHGKIQRKVAFICGPGLWLKALW
jgi:hypothetical protein